MQATRPESEPRTKEYQRLVKLRYLAREVRSAIEHPEVVLGFKITPRDDWRPESPCPLALRLAGVYLPDELPELFPIECPDDDGCACVLYNTVLAHDKTSDADYLRKRLADRGLHAQN